MKTQFHKDTLASELVDYKSDNPSGLEFSKKNLHHFCSPLFLKAMYVLFDKNIQTISCGSGKERGILPGITCNFDTLTEENKSIAKDLIISESQFRIGSPIDSNTTLEQFEKALMEIVDKFKSQ
ncbi:MAG: hypothetical protein FWE13_04570 [Firmicutes bacterium]|nr:hypothetical protein [Bacillota bacterium]